MIKARLPSAGFFFTALFFLLLFFASRLIALEALPLHNDEGLHLTRAVEVWNGNPFWEIRDGKIINHWLIALFYPQNAPVFIGRIATIFTSLLGFAACLALTRRMGMPAVALGALLWLCSPFMFFYDRMAFSDAQAGALGLLALWAACLTSPAVKGGNHNNTGRHEWRPYRIAFVGTTHGSSPRRIPAFHAARVAVLLALALLFKFTAAPYVLGVALLVMTRRESLRSRVRTLAIIAAVVAAAFVVPVAVLLSRGSSLFDIALDWVGAGGTDGIGGLTLVENLWRLASLLGWGNPLHAVMLVVGWAGALGWMLAPDGAGRTRHASSLQRFAFVVSCLIPMAVVVALGRDAQSRHFAAAIPPLVAIAAIGWGWGIQRLFLASPPDGKTRPLKRTRQALEASQRPVQGAQIAGALMPWHVAQILILAALLLVPFVPFAFTAYRNPAATNMPPLMAWQYVEGYASGYGLREAVEAFPQTLEDTSLQIVASMYGDSCRRANFYARDARRMLCGDAPMRSAIEAALARDGAVYVLVERGGEIGIDVTTLDVQAAVLGVYPRPNETGETARVRLLHMAISGRD